MKIVSERVAKQVVTMANAVAVVEGAFAALERGDASVFPVARAHGSSPSNSFGCKAGLIASGKLTGVKIGSYWPGNHVHGLPNHGSTTLFLADDTGLPRALVAASHLTALRTAAADAVAVKYLARPDASTVGLVGAGHQAWFDLLAIREVRPIRRVHVWSKDPANARNFSKRVVDELGLEAEALEIDRLARESDVIVTATAARQPLVHRRDVLPGTHISAMGADGLGKQELDVELVENAVLFADLVEQSITIGEFQHAAGRGVIDPKSIATLGGVVCGAARRRSQDEITIFDSSGLAIQDLAIGAFAIESADSAGLLETIDFS